MDFITGRPNVIEDYLVRLHPYQWFKFIGNPVHANLVLSPHYGTANGVVDNAITELPTEQECEDGLRQLQEDFDALEWKRNRLKEYPKIHELVVALYDTEDKLAIETKRAAIKLKYPKS